MVVNALVLKTLPLRSGTSASQWFVANAMYYQLVTIFATERDGRSAGKLFTIPIRPSDVIVAAWRIFFLSNRSVNKQKNCCKYLIPGTSALLPFLRILGSTQAWFEARIFFHMQ